MFVRRGNTEVLQVVRVNIVAWAWEVFVYL